MPSLHERIGRRVKEARSRLEITQADLAGRLDLEEPTVRSIEAGRRGVSVETLLRLAEALGVPPGELLDQQPLSGTGIGRESAKLVDELDLRWQKAVLRIIREVHGRVAGTQPAAKGKRR